ncbi:hypothetical protein [Desulfoferula mesophila]|uniref:Uncharacterized protein n=1 Tax=Desulfoferula mesophila TaxID=3058419 RepID=A0AAU9F121_9BACT|nr:hypothetical protein FAK_38420 [Desulfoferula mesophilus]
MSLMKTKTFWTGLAGLFTAVGAYYAGEASLGEAMQTGLTGLVAIFLRQGLLGLAQD